MVELGFILTRIYSKKGGLTFAWMGRKTLLLRPVLQPNQSFLCSIHSNRDRGGEELDSQVVSMKRRAS